MTWLTLLLAALLPAGAVSSPPPSSPRHAVAAPVRARPCREAGLTNVDLVPGGANLKSIEHPRPQAANRRLAERRIRPLAHSLVPNGAPGAVNLAAIYGDSDPHAVPRDGVQDPFERYARIIFPVPPPR